VTIPTFLCSSDIRRTVQPDWGPTSYAVNAGSGGSTGAYAGTDGVFGIGSATRLTDITDGSSNTALVAEHLLGTGTPATPATVPAPFDRREYYAWLAAAPLSDAGCSASAGYSDRGSRWADGGGPFTQYTHRGTPNAPAPDCAGFFGGWKAARSRHTGGVNVTLGDGSVRFVHDSISPTTWAAVGTRTGGEVPGDNW
jgi:prepilin-type processing-associated H-X9-DG protein